MQVKGLSKRDIAQVHAIYKKILLVTLPGERRAKRSQRQQQALAQALKPLGRRTQAKRLLRLKLC